MLNPAPHDGPPSPFTGAQSAFAGSSRSSARHRSDALGSTAILFPDDFRSSMARPTSTTRVCPPLETQEGSSTCSPSPAVCRPFLGLPRPFLRPAKGIPFNPEASGSPAWQKTRGWEPAFDGMPCMPRLGSSLSTGPDRTAHEQCSSHFPKGYALVTGILIVMAIMIYPR